MKIYKEIVVIVVALIAAVGVAVALVVSNRDDNKATVDGVSPRIIETNVSSDGE